jgi:hypothetical protein
MPIAARTKIVVEESCLRTPSLTFTYKGPNPQDIYKKVKKLLPTIFKVDEHDIEEREFLWDRSTPEEKFKTVLNFVKEFDPTSYMEVQISLEGFAKPSKEFGKEGEATITIESKFRVEYPQETFWQRSIFFSIYQKLFGKSGKEIKEYKKKCSELVNLFCDELRSYLNILVKG